MAPSYPRDTTGEERIRWSNALASLPVLEQAASATVETLFNETTFLRHCSGVLVFDERDAPSFAWILIEGIVRVSQRDPRGSEYTPKIFSAPTHFGELAALADLDSYRSSIQTLTPCVTAQIPTSVLKTALAADNRLCFEWLRSVARQHSITIDSDRQSVFGGLKSRVANVLLGYADVFGHEVLSSVEIGFPLSYEALARHVGCTRRGAIKVMQAMQQRKLVRQGGGSWVIDRKELERNLLPDRLSLASSLGKK